MIVWQGKVADVGPLALHEDGSVTHAEEGWQDDGYLKQVALAMAEENALFREQLVEAAREKYTPR